MKLRRYGSLFALGGGLYVILELLWRGRSHISMFFAGGLSLALIGGVEDARPRLPLWLRIPVGAGIITMVELATGLLVNRQFTVWDYRHRGGNFLGQICPAYCALWVPLAAAAGWLCRRLGRVQTSSRP